MNITRPWSLMVLALLSACTTQPPTNALSYRAPDHATQPEAASGNTTKPGWGFTRQAVAAANPLATDAGHQVLRAGGSPELHEKYANYCWPGALSQRCRTQFCKSVVLQSYAIMTFKY